MKLSFLVFWFISYLMQLTYFEFTDSVSKSVRCMDF